MRNALRAHARDERRWRRATLPRWRCSVATSTGHRVVTAMFWFSVAAFYVAMAIPAVDRYENLVACVVFAQVGVFGVMHVPMRSEQCGCEQCLRELSYSASSDERFATLLETAGRRRRLHNTAGRGQHLVRYDSAVPLGDVAYATDWEFRLAQLLRFAAHHPVTVTATGAALLHAIADRTVAYTATVFAEHSDTSSANPFPCEVVGPLEGDVIELVAHFAERQPLAAAATIAEAVLVDTVR